VKIGIKIFSEKDFAKHFENKADFLEIMAIEGRDYSFLKGYALPIVIHAQHQQFGVNCASKAKLEKNTSSMNFAIKLANEFNAKKIILHPGELNDKDSSKENSINFIKGLNDRRILIENLLVREEDYLCALPEETKEFIEKTGKGFCFDINHAVSTALALKQNYKEMLKEFVKLKPKHYHIGGQKLKENDIGHLPLEESELPLKEILGLLPKDAEITLETESDIKKTEKDIETIRKEISEL
jgi:sugar phosphate isomerase/epimerase